ncbi:CAP domain-containing protein [Streptomyces longwoodensis]
MGRHRRSDAGRAATGRATGAAQPKGPFTRGHSRGDSYGSEGPTLGIAPYLNPEAYAEEYARSHEYLYAVDDVRGGEGYGDDGPRTAVFASDGFGGGEGGHAAGGHGDDGFTPDRGAGPGHRRRKRAATPVKTGLLGVSAAVALGTVAVATGVVPGLENYQLGGGTSTGDKVQAGGAPTNSASEQGGTSGAATESRDGTPTSRGGTGRSVSPSPSASTSAPASASPSTPPSASPTRTAPAKPSATPSTKEPAPSAKAPSRSTTKAPQRTGAPVTVSAEAQAAAQVLNLVNEERAKVGCSPVAANSALADLAARFSDDMAARGFFDHTDPDGKTPWDRASAAGISDLGGENIARGQADAAAVMEAWMNSPGHRANILNCDFKTLGVGVHMGPGGPWWTQDFGY